MTTQTSFVSFGIYPEATYVLESIFNRTITERQHRAFDASPVLPYLVRGISSGREKRMTRPAAGHMLVTFLFYAEIFCSRIIPWTKS